MQIDANTIKKLIEVSSRVIIMSHRNVDLDALGSSLGIYYLCRSLGKEACLLIEDKGHEAGVARALKEIKNQKINIEIKQLKELEDEIDKDTLLFIQDTNIASLTQCPTALKIKNKIVIDHHIKDGDAIDCVYEYISEEQSSTVEIVIELIDYFDTYIPPYIASIMLAGMFIDTNGFFSKTNYKTHQGASYLYKCGAQLKELQYLLKEDVNKYNDRQKVVSEAETIKHHYMIALGHENKIYNKEDLAKMADNMLLFQNIEASFAIGKIDEHKIGISARSLGNVNVQKMMEKLGGGGHLLDAATQLTNISIDEAKNSLVNIINKTKGEF